MTVTQTPSAREPQAIAALREKVGNGWREHGAKDILAAYDALVAERDALRGVVEKARQLDAVVYGNRPGGAGSFDERHRAQVEFIDTLRALDENNKS